LQGFKLQFEIYLVPTKPLVVPENLRKLIQILKTHTVYILYIYVYVYISELGQDF
jgi:hypothetical protein